MGARRSGFLRWSSGALAATALASTTAGCSSEDGLTWSKNATSELGGAAAGGSGASSAVGGTPSAGGTIPTGGAAPTGGSGDSPSTGGGVATGGAALGGSPTSGGMAGTGSAPESGGAPETGGTGTGAVGSGTGGANVTGDAGASGTTTTGGANQNGGTGGTPGGAGAAGDGGTGGEPEPTCPSAPCADTNQQNRTCTDGDEIPLGRYRILNNLWGGQGLSAPDGQCTWNLCSGGSLTWGTEFQWNTGDSISVKSYAAVVLGWHWSAIDGSSGLPVQLSAGHDIPTSWSFDVDIDAGGSLNVAYDLWVHTSAEPPMYGNPSDEVMVWIYAYQKDDPIGDYDRSVNVGGADWDLYEGSNGSNQVHSFLRTPYVKCDDLNLRDFLDTLVELGYLQPSQYLIGIEAGPEVVKGTGSVSTRSYSCNVQ
jgi:xyloglucan-specific endo-beta-1,4-glucanase